MVFRTGTSMPSNYTEWVSGSTVSGLGMQIHKWHIKGSDKDLTGIRAYVYIYIYVCMCMCVYICIYVNAFAYMYIYI